MLVDEKQLVYTGMRTPWGSAQTARILAPGIGMVDTAGHGGIKLSREKQSKVPDYLRREGGWYEEDCEANIPLMIFEQEIREHGPGWLITGIDKHPPAKSIANHWPDAYERYFNCKLSLEDSVVLRDRAFAAANANNYVTCSAWGDWQDGVPAGMVGVYACIGENRNTQGKYFLVPAEEYKDRKGQFVIDLERHPEVSDFTKRETA